jgi:hypothetical protein
MLIFKFTVYEISQIRAGVASFYNAREEAA